MAKAKAKKAKAKAKQAEEVMDETTDQTSNLHAVAEAAILATTKRTLELFTANIGQVTDCLIQNLAANSALTSCRLYSPAPTSFRAKRVALPRRLPPSMRQ
jgi:hypothetical protein